MCDVESGARLLSTTGSVRTYSRDGRWLALVNADEHTLILLDAETHETGARFRGHEGPIRSVAFSCGPACGVAEVPTAVSHHGQHPQPARRPTSSARVPRTRKPV